ncbi:MAG TPA: DNA alkylation repair protein [Planctomycetota bacterium]|jgi:3-methyladenine DNA glycosylase AlkD|nr:DNA alkylation repair protein [Planctomycetota bacterium]OQC21120.1 MAG: DNA alkylation repair enzyme [Planctomycetes bacterium ADurb.Bin069]HNR99801.1 DNA alkylation repair protein [Planctomycetota bacterium]HNU26962.1 DNA alkylation repair protein [Planctomycetota bacterium]HOE29860.1 DNA alkylation repair protein [Planctomycetota bacterium]
MRTTAPRSPSAAALRAALRARADPAKAAHLARFFKRGPGQYAENDRFLGIAVPELRALARRHLRLSEGAVESLLASPYHEARLAALLILAERFAAGSEEERARVYAVYVRNLARVDNWDLVDLTAPRIAGEHLVDRDRAPLYAWARSPRLWTRRIAIVATHAFIRRGDFADTLAIAALLLGDGEDLIRKATGWMLREVGKRDRAAEEAFLRRHLPAMPRTTLRYAIERFPEGLRRAYLRGEV